MEVDRMFSKMCSLFLAVCIFHLDFCNTNPRDEAAAYLAGMYLNAKYSLSLVKGSS